MLVLGEAPVYDHRVNGNWVAPCDSIGWYTDDLRARIQYLRTRGLAIVFVMPSRPGSHSTFSFADDYTQRMNCVRGELRRFLQADGVPVVDPDPYLCPQDQCDTFRARDGVHIDPARAPEVLNWIVSRVLTAAAGAS